MKNNRLIEDYLAKPYWVIDFLPKQVPADSKGQFFNIEKHLLEDSQHGILLQKFANVLLKLNCYYDFDVCRCAIDEWSANPSPDLLSSWVAENESLCIIINDADAMITLNRDDINMTLYNPREELLELARDIATSEGLFLWNSQVNG
ncbi:MAG: hypothetical protein J6X22_06710 [Muribaculaceae bacterium]|nr:hypothetical protein [Muribaculaceae bacterium]